MSWTVAALCAGRSAPLAGSAKSRSAIHKYPLLGPVRIGLRGVETDEQVDRRYHGFAAMALHHFPHDHYQWLCDSFDHPEPLAARGGFGENLSTDGLTEELVCIGDRYRLGSAIIEVTQPRQPCSTIEKHFARKGVVKAIVATARSGWFYRVIEPGVAEAGDPLEKIEDGHTEWTVAHAFRAVFGKRPAPAEDLMQLHGLERVSDRLQGDIRKRLGADLARFTDKSAPERP